MLSSAISTSRMPFAFDDDDDDVVDYYVRKTRKLSCDSFTAFIALVVVIRKSEHVLKVHIPLGGVMIR